MAPTLLDPVQDLVLVHCDTPVDSRVVGRQLGDVRGRGAADQMGSVRRVSGGGENGANGPLRGGQEVQWGGRGPEGRGEVVPGAGGYLLVGGGGTGVLFVTLVPPWRLERGSGMRGAVSVSVLVGTGRPPVPTNSCKGQRAEGRGRTCVCVCPLCVPSSAGEGTGVSSWAERAWNKYKYK